MDQFHNEDDMSLHLVNIVNQRMGSLAMTSLHLQFDDYEDNRVLRVQCERSPQPVYVTDGEREIFYIRTGPATIEISGGQMLDYIGHRFK